MGCKQTKCLFFENGVPEKVHMPPMSKTGPDISKNKLRRVKLPKAPKYTFPPPQLYFDTSLIIRLSLFTSKPRNTRFFIINFFSTQPQCCFTFS